MSRTIKEVRVIGRSPQEIQKCLNDWFMHNGFEVKEQSSIGIPFTVRKWYILGSGADVVPHVGSMVAILLKFSGCVIFEISLQRQGNDTILHGEFYAAGVSEFKGQEWEVSPKPELVGRWPKKRGYEAMTNLLQTVEKFSGKPLPEL